MGQFEMVVPAAYAASLLRFRAFAHILSLLAVYLLGSSDNQRRLFQVHTKPTRAAAVTRFQQSPVHILTHTLSKHRRFSCIVPPTFFSWFCLINTAGSISLLSLLNTT
jgi:hypothetical protein